MKPEDLVYGKHNFNRYGTIISFVSNFLTEVTDTDETYKMLNEFNNETNELKSDYLAGQDEEIDDVIENASLVYNNQLNFLMIIYLGITKELKQNEYLQINHINQDRHQYDSRHKKLLLKE